MQEAGNQRRDRRRLERLHREPSSVQPSSSWHRLSDDMRLAWGCLGQEMLEFPYHRARECMKSAREIMHCHGAVELVDAQYRYAQELVHDYLDEAGWLAETWSQACTKSWVDLQSALVDHRADADPQGPR